MKKSQLKAIIKEEIQLLNEARMPLSKQLDMVISGSSKTVEGTKISKKSAEKLKNLYLLKNFLVFRLINH